MAGSVARLLRLLVQADKEAIITQFTPTPFPIEFSGEISKNTRKGIAIYNHTKHANSDSGECFFGFNEDTMSPSGESMPIPQGALFDVPIASCDAIDLFIQSASGEKTSDLRFIEVA